MAQFMFEIVMACTKISSQGVTIAVVAREEVVGVSVPGTTSNFPLVQTRVQNLSREVAH